MSRKAILENSEIGQGFWSPADSPAAGLVPHGPRSQKNTFSDPKVIDDFPDRVPVAARELDVIEMYLGRLLDEMLRLDKENGRRGKDGIEA
jgi:hypothetical protein